jgi:hypothetical protein
MGSRHDRRPIDERGIPGKGLGIGDVQELHGTEDGRNGLSELWRSIG